MEIRLAHATDIATLLPLVADYYAASPVPHIVDADKLTAHLHQLIAPANPLGGLLVASLDGEPVGFAFLYFGFDKRALARVVDLNDLFVAKPARRQGIARALMHATFDWAKAQGAVGVTWQTRTTNTGAQQLYDQLGKREAGWIHYRAELPRS